MRKLGCILLVLGVGALVLPICGFQFILVSAAEQSGMSIWGFSILAILTGIVVLVVDNFAEAQRAGSYQGKTDENVDLLIKSGLTQRVIADIALGSDMGTTISSLVEVGISEPAAKKFVDALSSTFMEMPDEKREQHRQAVVNRMEAIGKALANGVGKETIIQDLMRSDGFTEEQAEANIEYYLSVYKLRKENSE